MPLAGLFLLLSLPCRRQIEIGICRAASRHVELVTATAVDATVLLYKHKVKQAIGNVLDNAIEVSPAGAHVEVEPVLEHDVVRIAVRDYGPGVDPAIRTRLFTPFCTTKPHGVGLGLALARELLEAHGGGVDWHDAAPGTTFVLRVPLEPPSQRPPG